MNNKAKTILYLILLVVFLAGAYVLYTVLTAEPLDKEGMVYKDPDSAYMEGSAVSAGLSAEAGTQEEGSESEEQETAPDFTMENEEGEASTLSSHLGKPVILNFWASWCPPCRGEMPHFQTIYEEYGEEIDFIMLDLTDGERETVSTGAEFIRSSGYTFPVYYDTDSAGGISYGVFSIPMTFFISPEGVIQDRQIGAMEEETLREKAEALLGD